MCSLLERIKRQYTSNVERGITGTDLCPPKVNVALADDIPFGPFGAPPHPPFENEAGSGVANSVCLLFHLEMFLAI